MYCEHLSLVNFRNFARLDLDLPAGITIVLGENAQGKSNLLEALHVLATIKSFRAINDRDMINWQVSQGPIPEPMAVARITGRIRRGQRPLRVDVVIQTENHGMNGIDEHTPSKGTSKRIRLNEAPKRAVDVIGETKVVMFAPQDTDLVDGPPLLRRRYLDVTISQIDPRYCRSLTHYQRVIVQRNHLLRQIREGDARPEQLEFWDREMIESGAYIIAQRQGTVTEIDRLAREIHQQLANNNETLRIAYRSSLRSSPISAAATNLDYQRAFDSKFDSQIPKIIQTYKQAIAHAHTKEIASGSSLYGPHRDDLALTINDRELAAFGSRGQQRTAALSLKLAEAEFMRAQTGVCPVLLLDDVLSEFDQKRRQHVMEIATTYRQVIITSTDASSFSPETLANANVLNIEQGIVSSWHGSSSD